MIADAIPDVVVEITTAVAAMAVDAAAELFPHLEMAEVIVLVSYGSFVFCAAAETTTDVVATTIAVMTAAGSLSFFCSCVETITDADVITAVDLLSQEAVYFLTASFF